jgi:cytoskeletal protein CcmA (bactofilin family)
MFSKTKQPAPAPRPETKAEPIPPLPDLTAAQAARKPSAPAPMAAPSRTASLLSADLTFEGNIIGSGDLHIDGTVRGDVKVGRLTVGETGNVEGGIQADTVEIRGRVVGAVSGKQVKLVGTAFVDGDISHEQLSIDVGAYFQGRCLQSRKADPAPSSASSSPAAAVGFATPSYGASAPSSSPAAAPAQDTGQLIELKPASA